MGAAADRLDAAAEAEARRGAERDALLGRRLRRPDPAQVRSADERVAAASAERVDASAGLALARQRLAALEPDALATAQLHLRQRLERIDSTIARRVRDAVASPAPYLATALGPRPSDATQRERWNEAARHIETWRHAELGLGPADGPAGDEGLSAALGPLPADPALAMRRDLAIRHMPVEFQPQRTAERTMDGPALTID